MTIKEKIERGEEFDAKSDYSFFADLIKCEEKCMQYNQILPSKMQERTDFMKEVLDETDGDFWIHSPFHCTYGYNIKIGKDFCSNINLVIIDAAPVTFGDYVMIGPNSGFYTSGHSLNAEKRRALISYAHPITVGNNVWFGGNVTVLGNVTIGDNAVIAAGSVVTKDIPANSLAAGIPAKVIRSLENEK